MWPQLDGQPMHEFDSQRYLLVDIAMVPSPPLMTDRIASLGGFGLGAPKLELSIFFLSFLDSSKFHRIFKGEVESPRRIAPGGEGGGVLIFSSFFVSRREWSGTRLCTG